MGNYILKLFSRRTGNLLGFLACAALIASAYYLQWVKGVEPCPLCIMQRVAVFATGVAFLAAALHHPGRVGARVYGALTALLALAGAAVAGRHVWLQYIPAEKRPACGPGLEYLLGTFGPLEGVRRILRGSGECGVVDFTILGLSLPHWTLFAFIVFIFWSIAIALRD
ncbi:MAG: disulfide bond formation protein B [Betaproteobacteria bacterium]|nr:disulfide bond formation protein B [Betaproteobacteria bacterium]